MALTARQSIEVFHLVFLRALAAKGEDKALFALKGGSNLRFFFGSVRYSEDIDVDVSVVSKGTLKNKVDRLLVAPTIVGPLKAHSIEVVDVSAPKQTDTTQRWKVGLRAGGVSVPLRTKIEFSRRKSLSETAFEAVDREVLLPYGLTPFLTTHYGLAGAILQKIHALSARSEPQARDVFDLNHLLAKRDSAKLKLSVEQKRWLSNAIDHGMGISFDDYSSQVMAFLEPSQRELFEGRASWDAMQTAVMERLEGLR